MNCTEINDLLGAYVDGELELRTSLAIEGHLETCAKCRATAQGVQALGSAISRACERAVAPDRLRGTVRSKMSVRAGRRPARGAWLAAAPGVAALLVTGWLALTQPWSTASNALAGQGMRIVYHIAGADHVDASLRTLKNHLDAVPGLHVVVVAHNDGIKFLLQGASDGAGQPYVDALRDFRERGVEFRVCANTLARRQIDARSVVPEAALVASGIAEISRLQGREGYTYLRL
jgi:intracellular sulfur oxidation DsrE/DsrF family protein